MVICGEFVAGDVVDCGEFVVESLDVEKRTVDFCTGGGAVPCAWANAVSKVSARG
jgi:hypothetical protein